MKLFVIFSMFILIFVVKANLDSLGNKITRVTDKIIDKFGNVTETIGTVSEKIFSKIDDKIILLGNKINKETYGKLKNYTYLGTPANYIKLKTSNYDCIKTAYFGLQINHPETVRYLTNYNELTTFFFDAHNHGLTVSDREHFETNFRQSSAMEFNRLALDIIEIDDVNGIEWNHDMKHKIIDCYTGTF